MSAPYRDPAIERVAIALAWCDRVPAFLPRLDQQTHATELLWWNAQTDIARDGYRYKAAMAIEAYHETEVSDAAE